MQSWISISSDSDFSLHNVPFGIIKTAHKPHCAATILGETVIDLAEMAKHGFFEDLGVSVSVLEQPYLNDFIALGKSTTNAVRTRIQSLFSAENQTLQNNEAAKAAILYKAEEWFGLKELLFV